MSKTLESLRERIILDGLTTRWADELTPLLDELHRLEKSWRKRNVSYCNADDCADELQAILGERNP